jgi:hypothetical protein
MDKINGYSRKLWFRVSCQTNLHHRPQFQSVSERVEPTIGIEPMNLFLTKEALYRLSYVGFAATDLLHRTYQRENGGGGRIRTSEGFADRFTVCSLWPLGNPTIWLHWSQRRDSNPRPTDYKSVALPAELRWHQLRKPIHFIKDPLKRHRGIPGHLKTQCLTI